MDKPELKNKIKKVLKEAIRKREGKPTESTDPLIFELRKMAIAMKENPMIQFVSNMPKEIAVSNLKDVPSEVSIKNIPKEIKVSNFPDEIKIAKPKWWKEPDKKEIQKVEIVGKAEKPGWIDGAISGAVTALGGAIADTAAKLFEVSSKFFAKLWAAGLSVRFDRPQQIVMIDPFTGTPIGKKDFGGGGGNTSHTFFNAAGRDPVGIKNNSGQKVNPATEDKQAPYDSVGNGNTAVTAAGTAVPLSATSVPCKRVFVQSHESNGDLTNGGLIVVGGSGVKAALATRAGRAIYPTNGDWFLISNLNLLYIDSVDNGAKVHYYYEN